MFYLFISLSFLCAFLTSSTKDRWGGAKSFSTSLFDGRGADRHPRRCCALLQARAHLHLCVSLHMHVSVCLCNCANAYGIMHMCLCVIFV